VVSNTVTLNALPYGLHRPLLGVQKYELSFDPLLETCVFMILWKVVYLYSDCRRDSSFVPEFLWNPLFIYSIVTLNQVFAGYIFVGITGKWKYFDRIANTFIENTFFYFNFIVLFVVLLIKKFAHNSLLAFSSFAYKLYYFFASPYNLAISSFEKSRFEVKISRSLICTLFSHISWGNDAYLYLPRLVILIWNFLLLPIVTNRQNDGRNKR